MGCHRLLLCTPSSAHRLYCIHVQSLSCFLLFATPWTIAHQAPLSMEFSSQECWSGLSFPSPGDLPHQGIKPKSPVSPPLANRLSLNHQESPSQVILSESEIAQSCPAHSDPMDCSPPGSSAHGIFHARVLEWVAINVDFLFYVC